jgi:hypothetical protein
LEAHVSSVTDEVSVRDFLPFEWFVNESEDELSFSFGNNVDVKKVDGGSEGRNGSKCEQDFGIVEG